MKSHKFHCKSHMILLVVSSIQPLGYHKSFKSQDLHRDHDALVRHHGHSTGSTAQQEVPRGWGCDAAGWVWPWGTCHGNLWIFCSLRSGSYNEPVCSMTEVFDMMRKKSSQSVEFPEVSFHQWILGLCFWKSPLVGCQT